MAVNSMTPYRKREIFGIGSVALRGTPFIESIKRRDDVKVIMVTEKNREDLVGFYREFE